MYKKYRGVKRWFIEFVPNAKTAIEKANNEYIKEAIDASWVRPGMTAKEYETGHTRQVARTAKLRATLVALVEKDGGIVA